MKDVNSVTLVCRLTRDPELRALGSGMSVCSMRCAFSTSRKDQSSGEWSDKSNYVDVTVWGNQAESCDKYLTKGRQVGIQGRLEWREWTTKDGGKRQALEIVAEQVQFLGGGEERPATTSSGMERYDTDVPIATDDLDEPVAAVAAADDDDSIPFLWEGPNTEGDLFHAHESR